MVVVVEAVGVVFCNMFNQPLKALAIHALMAVAVVAVVLV
tara:strand:- start:136 stop:255 length:120 start_codon:yes stop_codon:yes gene_type:complete